MELTLDTKHSASLTADIRNSAGSFTDDRKSGIFMLLMETGDYLLRELGDKFILESASGLTLDIRN